MGLILVGDIGGTNARLALLEAADGPFLGPAADLLCGAYESLDALVMGFLDARGLRASSLQAAVAVAGPVRAGAAQLTNLPWSVSQAGLEQLGFSRAIVVNDYEALALAAPHIKAEDKAPIGPLLVPHPGTIAVLGPGTGFGAAAYCRDARGSAVLVTEGGHVGFAPSDPVEQEILRILAQRFGRVSLERILSGPGLANLFSALGQMEGAGAQALGPAAVLDAARAGDRLAQATLERFCSILGAAGGDFALAYGAVGGVLLAGGIAPRILDTLSAGGFRRAFEQKGRLETYLAMIPTAVLTQPYVALIGAAQSLERR